MKYTAKFHRAKEREKMRKAIGLLTLVILLSGCAHPDGYWRKDGSDPEQLQRDYSECFKKRYFGSRDCMSSKGYAWETEGNRKLDFSPFGSIPIGRQKHFNEEKDKGPLEPPEEK